MFGKVRICEIEGGKICSFAVDWGVDSVVWDFFFYFWLIFCCFLS